LKQYACQAKFHFALQHGFGAAGATLVSGEYSVSENRAGGPPRPGGEAQDEAPPPGARAANHPSPSPFPAGVWRRAGVCVWAAAVAFTGVVAVREANAEFIVDRIQRQIATGGPTTPHPAPCLPPCPARAHEAMAAEEVRAFRESATPSPADPALVRAQAHIHRSLARNPLYAASWSRLAQIQAYASPDAPERALATLAISYQAAPYDPTGAGFRIDYVLSHWSAAPRPLRRKALDECVWLAGVNPELLDQLRAKPRDPAAEYALELAISQADETM
jgi:hypothetical protein